MATGGDAVVAALESLDVDHVYGIVSVHNLPIYESLRHSSITPVAVRHEQTALAAADGAARATDRLGVAITSTGPGAANGMAATLEAVASGSPLLHLTGQVDTRYLDTGRGFIHECPDQLGMLRACNKHAARAAEGAGVARSVLDAAAAALSFPRGPAAVEIPIDVQYGEAEPPPRLASAMQMAPTEVPAGIDELSEMIGRWRRPIIWAGGGATHGEGPALVRALAERLGAGVLTTPNGRGVLPEDHPLCIGNLSLEAAVGDLLTEADGILLVGTRMQGPNTMNWSLSLPSEICQIDVDAVRIGQNYPVKAAAVGDTAVVVDAVLGALDGRGAEPGWQDRVRAAAKAARDRLYTSLGAQAVLYDELQRRLDAEDIVVKDATIPAYTWGNRLLRVHAPRRSIMPNSFAIGLGLGHAIGAARASGRRTLCIAGDGGFMLGATDLATVAELDLPVVVLVFNDGGYGILRNIQSNQYGDGGAVGSDLLAPSFVGLAESLGVPARKATTGAEYALALDWAMAKGGPALIETDLLSIGPMATPYIGTSRPPGAVAAAPAPSSAPPYYQTNADNCEG